MRDVWTSSLGPHAMDYNEGQSFRNLRYNMLRDSSFTNPQNEESELLVRGENERGREREGEKGRRRSYNANSFMGLENLSVVKFNAPGMLPPTKSLDLTSESREEEEGEAR